MKRLIRSLAIGLISVSLVVPSVQAQGRRQGATQRTESRNNRGNDRHDSGNRNSAGNRSGQRPGATSGNRPDRMPGNRGNNGHGNSNSRPGNSNNNRPGNNNGNVRPGDGHNNYRPGNNGGHHNNRPTPPPQSFHRPGSHGSHGMPPFYQKPPQHHPVFHRPVPPPSFRPGPRYPSFGTILGLALGSAFNASINYFNTNGYIIDGYTANQLFLRNVRQMNYLWPEAVMYYNNGYLSGSQFIYSLGYNDASRYYNLYNTFLSQYGMPVSVSNSGATLSASWFGYDNRYVTIRYTQGYNEFGAPCFYTTLSFGN